MYPLAETDEGIEMTYSKPKMRNGKLWAQVCVERFCDINFQSAWCILPEYRWEDVDGFTDEELEMLTAEIKKREHLIFK